MTDGFEKKRIQDLKSMKLLNSLPEKEYDDITSLAAFICNTPISLIALVTDTRQFFKSRQGVDVSETPIEQSFCAYAIKVPQKPFIVEDARKDMRFKDNPLVTGQPNISFYAGIPLISSEGNALGTLCVIDNKPRKLEQKQLEALKSLANQVVHLFELRKKRMEIEQSEKRFKGLVQSGSDLIAILDFEANYQYVSPTSVNVLGITPEEFMGKNAFEFIHPDDKEAAYASLLRLENKKQLTLKPFRFKHGDGSWRWIEAIITNLMEDSAIGGLVANSRDITERILSEETLKKSEAYYRGLYNSQTNYVLRTDMEGNYTYANKKFIEEFGWLYPDGKILGKNSMPSIMDYHHQRVEEKVGQCIAEHGKVFKVELDKPTSDGKIITTLWDFVCIVDPEGIPSEIQCIGLDITARIKAEKAVKESEQRYSDLFHLSPQPMWVYDIDTLKFMDVNEAAIKHYRYSYEEFLNMTIREIRPKSEIPKLEAAILQLKQKEKSYSSGEYLHKKKNGQEIIVEIRGNILFYKGKKAEVVLATDITERYNHIKAIEAQNEKLRKIAWTQSHVVRAPLARMMGLIDLLKEDSPSVDQKEREQLLEHVFQSATEFDEIVRNIVNTTQQNSENYTLGN